MDPLSITAACIGLISTVTKLSLQINDFIRKAREARADLDVISRELVSLQTVLEILSDDAGTEKYFPENLVRQISGILSNCGGVLEQIEGSLRKHGAGGLGLAVKWSLSGRDDMNKLRSSLEAHKSALDIALDMVSLTIAREVKTNTEEIRNDTMAIKEDTSLILAEIARLQARLPDVERNGHQPGYTLQRYLDNLTSYAASSWDIDDAESDEECDQARMSIAITSDLVPISSDPIERLEGGKLEKTTQEGWEAADGEISEPGGNDIAIPIRPARPTSLEFGSVESLTLPILAQDEVRRSKPHDSESRVPLVRQVLQHSPSTPKQSARRTVPRKGTHWGELQEKQVRDPATGGTKQLPLSQPSVLESSRSKPVHVIAKIMRQRIAQKMRNENAPKESTTARLTTPLLASHYASSPSDFSAPRTAPAVPGNEPSGTSGGETWKDMRGRRGIWIPPAEKAKTGGISKYFKDMMARTRRGEEKRAEEESQRARRDHDRTLPMGPFWT